MRVLTINAGSTSLKLERYALGTHVPDIATPPEPEFALATQVASAERDIAVALGDVDAVGHRFVRLPDGAPPVAELDARFVAEIEAAGADAPLHDRSALDVVAIVAKLRPNLRQFAVGDSAFHRTMSEAATTYALPRDQTRAGLRRIGYHGLSHEYAAHRGCALAGLDVGHARTIIAHLGGGSSLCAIRDGASVDTTMGYTPLEGVPMATRSGSVDPGLVLHLLRSGMSFDALEDMLERKSGLLGMSGFSGDVRELVARPNDVAARLALDVLSWRLRAAFGALVATLGGVDLIVFTGGIGEHAAQIRAASLDGGLGIGVALDPASNGNVVEGRIETTAARVLVCVVTAREGWQIARAVARRPASLA